MTARSRRRRPAPGQLVFTFLLRWLPIEPPRPAPPPLPHGWWRRDRRKAPTTPVARSADRDDATIDRWLRRGAACVLCGSWPAPCDRRIGARLLLVCRHCDRRPETAERLNEIVSTDWAASPGEAVQRARGPGVPSPESERRAYHQVQGEMGGNHDAGVINPI
jgi:hypothetical protein